jgi:acyl-CoA thioester hydrolase
MGKKPILHLWIFTEDICSYKTGIAYSSPRFQALLGISSKFLKNFTRISQDFFNLTREVYFLSFFKKINPLARVKLKTFSSYAFSTEVKVRITDLNYGGHLGNEMILSYAQQARVEWLESLGYGELSLEGAGIIMADAAVQYKAEGHAGDMLLLEIAVDEISRVGFDLYYRMLNKQSGETIALAKTGIICFDYSSRKVVPIPEAAREKLEEYSSR